MKCFGEGAIPTALGRNCSVAQLGTVLERDTPFEHARECILPPASSSNGNLLFECVPLCVAPLFITSSCAHSSVTYLARLLCCHCFMSRSPRLLYTSLFLSLRPSQPPSIHQIFRHNKVSHSKSLGYVRFKRPLKPTRHPDVLDHHEPTDR